MKIGLFLENRIKRQLKMNGVECQLFKRYEDEFGQKENAARQGFYFIGLYHTNDSQLTVKDTVGSKSVSRREPRLLFLFSDGFIPVMDDIIMIRDKRYRVIGVNDVNGMGIAGDISLEVVKDGKQ